MQVRAKADVVEQDEPPRPRVSLGLPVYNAERYLAEALDAVAAQDHTDYELIICDNGSTDSTWRICEERASRDPRIRLYRNAANLGVAANFNRVVHEARGELFRWVAYDDLMAPTLLSECIAELDRSGPRTVLAYPRTLLIDDDGEVVDQYDDNLDIRHRTPALRVAAAAWRWNLLNPLYGVIRLDELRRTGLERPFVSGDVPLFMELAALGEIHEVPSRLFLRRFHADSSSGNSAAWYTPHRKGTERFPILRLTVRTLRALATSDHPPRTRVAITLTFAIVWSWRQTRITGGRYKALVRQSLQERGLTRAGRRPPT